MDKYIYDEKNGLWYELQGDYYLLCLRLPEETKVHIGIWGQRHRRYLKDHRKAAYTRLLTSGRLNKYLADIDHPAEELFSRLVSAMTANEGAPKRSKQMTRWNGYVTRTASGTVPENSLNPNWFITKQNPECRSKRPSVLWVLFRAKLCGIGLTSNGFDGANPAWQGKIPMTLDLTVTRS